MDNVILKIGCQFDIIKLEKVLFVPYLTLHLILVSRITNSPLKPEVTFQAHSLHDSRQNVYATAEILTKSLLSFKIVKQYKRKLCE